MSRKRPASFRTEYKKKATTSSNCEIPDASKLLTTAEAGTFLTTLCKPRYETTRQFKNKITGRIRYAIDKGHIRTDISQIKFSDLIDWARTKSSLAKGLTEICIPVTGTMSVSLQPLAVQIRVIQMPDTIAACHQLIQEADNRIAELETQLTILERQIEEQRPFVETGRLVRRKKKKAP